MQQFCTYGSVRGASGKPASLPRQKAINRLLTRHPYSLLRVAASPVHDFRSSPGVLLARGSESRLRVCMCLPSRDREEVGPQKPFSSAC